MRSLRSFRAYTDALLGAERLMDAEPGSEDESRLVELADAIEEYESEDWEKVVERQSDA